MTPRGDCVVVLDAKQVDLVATKGTKKNPEQWVIKKHGSQVGKLGQLKLKIVVLHDGIGKRSI